MRPARGTRGLADEGADGTLKLKAKSGAVQGGSITDGAKLSKWARKAIEAARLAPPSFASYRNLAAASSHELSEMPITNPHQTFIKPAVVVATGKR